MDEPGRRTRPCTGCGGAGVDVLGDPCGLCGGHGFLPAPCSACGELSEGAYCSVYCWLYGTRRKGGR